MVSSDEHHLVIQADGTIVNATDDTLLGISSKNYLMRNAFENVHQSDIEGLQGVVTHFWMMGKPEVKAYFRRQKAVSNQFIWVESSVVKYMDEYPEPAVCLYERRIGNEKRAMRMNLTMKVSTNLAKAFIVKQGDKSNSGGGDMFDATHVHEFGHEQEVHEQGQGQKHLCRGGSCYSNTLPNTKSSPGGTSFKRAGSDLALDFSSTSLGRFDVDLIYSVLSGSLQTKNLFNTVSMISNIDSEEARSKILLGGDESMNLSIPSAPIFVPPPVTSLNLSYTNIGNEGVLQLFRIVSADTPFLHSIDISFCSVGEVGICFIGDCLKKRADKKLKSLKILNLYGNSINERSASAFGFAISYAFFHPNFYPESKDNGFSVLHLSCTSLTPESFKILLSWLPLDYPLSELRVASNNLGVLGAQYLLQYFNCELESSSTDPLAIAARNELTEKKKILQNLSRLDLSQNKLGNNGVVELTKAINYRVANKKITELCLGHNSIDSLGIETMFNKLLQHNLHTLTLDNNLIGDQGCKLVAGSLSSMNELMTLSLSFNQIGTPGIMALMRALIGSASLLKLSLSGNPITTTGAIAVSFALAHHTRLEELHLDNCSIKKSSQCHIVAGIMSNRHVPMKALVGFRVGPAMAELGLLSWDQQHLCNSHCLQIRRNEQMRHILYWRTKNANSRTNQRHGEDGNDGSKSESNGSAKGETFTHDDVQPVIEGPTPIERMIECVRKIPFDDEELLDLRHYFYGVKPISQKSRPCDFRHRTKRVNNFLNAISEDEGSDSDSDDVSKRWLNDYDSRAGLDIDVERETTDAGSVGSEASSSIEVSLFVGQQKRRKQVLASSFDNDDDSDESETERVLGATAKVSGINKNSLKRSPSKPIGNSLCDMAKIYDCDSNNTNKNTNNNPEKKKDNSNAFYTPITKKRALSSNVGANVFVDSSSNSNCASNGNSNGNSSSACNSSSNSASNTPTQKKRGLGDTIDTSIPDSTEPTAKKKSRDAKTSCSLTKKNKDNEDELLGCRMRLFPEVRLKLEMLKQETIEKINAPNMDARSQGALSANYATTCLMYLRQLRYSCMNSRLDGWRHGRLARKMLIVDDSFVTRKLIKRAFEKANFVVDVAENGMLGVAKMKRNIYDIAFMDIEMPVMNGLDATIALREWEDVQRPGARQPICALTGAIMDDTDRQELAKFKAAGLDVLESKPCNLVRLFKVVDDVSLMFSDLSIFSSPVPPKKTINNPIPKETTSTNSNTDSDGEVMSRNLEK